MKVAGCGLRFRNPSGAISSTHPHGKSFPSIYVVITKISMYINAVKVKSFFPYPREKPYTNQLVIIEKMYICITNIHLK